MNALELGPGGVFQMVLSEYFLRYWIAAGGVWLLVNLGLSGWVSARRLRDTALPKGQVLREIASSMRSLVIFGVMASASIGAQSISSRPRRRENSPPWRAMTASSAMTK